MYIKNLNREHVDKPVTMTIKLPLRVHIVFTKWIDWTLETAPSSTRNYESVHKTASVLNGIVILSSAL